MRFTNRDLKLSVEFKDEVIDELVYLAKSHYPKEFGGILVGRYVDNNSVAVIENHVLPKKYSSSRYSFERGTDGLRSSLTKYFRAKPNKFYVGEWHTHPNGAPMPSNTDISALHEIVNHHEVFIENPILLIIAVKPNEYKLGIHVLYKDRVYSYDRHSAEKVKTNQEHP